MRPGGAELVTGEADGRCLAVSGFDKKRVALLAQAGFELRSAGSGQRNQTTTLLKKYE
jgi:hypothetical protein